MGFILSKGQGQRRVNKDHQMKMLHECRATMFKSHWGVKYDIGTYFLI